MTLEDDVKLRPIMAGLGVEIADLDLAQPQPELVIRTVRAAWVAHRLVLLRRQRLDAAAQLAFARWFGLVRPPERYVHPDLPPEATYSHLSNVAEGGSGGTGELLRHQDMTWETPLRGICLYAVAVPAAGGETVFIDGARAFERLDGQLREELRGRFATHVDRFAPARVERGDPHTPHVERTDQPVVLHHPETGRPILFVNEQNTTGIVGLDVAASADLLGRLLATFDDEELQYVHRWESGDVICWDNLSLQHYRRAFDPGEARDLRRVQIG